MANQPTADDHPVQPIKLPQKSMTAKSPGYSGLRKGRWSIQRQIYHLTWVTADRRPLFQDFYAARMLIRSLRFADQSGWSRTLAYVLMPDHLHWLIELRGGKTLSGVTASIKRYSATRLTTVPGIAGPIWQKGFHDHAARGDEDLVKLSRYIVANPIRAGLCTHVGDYPHWDAIWMGL